MVKIAVLVKQVPSADSRLTLNTDNLRLERSLTDPVLNPADLHAVEAALQVTDGTQFQTLTISMGPHGLEQSTKRALAMGIDESLIISDDALVGADVWLTANVLAKAIKHVDADFVFAGDASSDGQGGVVPAFVSKLLGWKFAEINNEQELDQVLNLKQPAIISVHKNFNSPRLPNFKGIAAAKTKPVTYLKLADLNISDFAPKAKVISQKSIAEVKLGERAQGTAEEMAQIVLSRIANWAQSEIASAPKSVLSVSDDVEIFEADAKISAAIRAAEKQVALITDVVSAADGFFTKEIFDGQIQVSIQSEGPMVITKAQNPQVNGISVGVGGGVSAIEDLRLVAKFIGADVVGTAAAIDKGFISAAELVGESGRSISPHIYLTFGVSGAHHHMVGLAKTSYVIAVNKDPEAEIFSKSDLAVIADADEVLSALVKVLGK
jgi:electron transfer flavoprotein beta subunit